MTALVEEVTGGEHRYVGYACSALQESSHEWLRVGRSVQLGAQPAPSTAASSRWLAASASTSRGQLPVDLNIFCKLFLIDRVACDPCDKRNQLIQAVPSCN
jgi:hypothetical protein